MRLAVICLLTSVSTTCFYHLRQLRRIRRSLDADSAATLVHAFVTSRVDYCNAILAAAPKTSWECWLTGVCSARRQCTGYLSNCCIPVSQVATQWHLRSAARQQLTVPRHRLSTYGRLAFAVAGPTMFNTLPDDLWDPAVSTLTFGLGTCEASRFDLNSNQTSRFDSKVTGRFENFESQRLPRLPSYHKQHSLFNDKFQSFRYCYWDLYWV